MEPTLPQPQAPPPMTPQTPYDFILGSNQQPQMRKPSGGGSQQKRIITVLVGALVVVIVGVIFMNILSNSGKGNTDAIKNLAAEQTELIRVASVGLPRARGSAAKNLATTVLATTSTTKSRTVKLIKLKKQTLLVKEANAKLDTTVVTSLDKADQNNTYDEVFVGILQQKLVQYQRDLQAAYNVSTDTNDRNVLGDSLKNVNIILEDQVNRSL